MASAQRLHDWAKAQGMPNVIPPEEMHVTIHHAKEKGIGPTYQPLSTATRIDKYHSIEHFDPEGKPVVVTLDPTNASAFVAQHEKALASGAQPTTPRPYIPHVTLSYDAAGYDKTDLPDFPLDFDPEVTGAVDVDLARKLYEQQGGHWKTLYSPDQAREPAGSPTGGQFVREGDTVGGFGSRTAPKSNDFDSPLHSVDSEYILGALKDSGKAYFDRPQSIEDVPTQQLTSWQNVVYKGVYPLSEHYEPIDVVKHNGRYIIWNGNHRSVSAWLEGRPTIKAKVLDLDKPGAAQKYLKSSYLKSHDHYSPDQPRVPAGSPEGGQFQGGQSLSEQEQHVVEDWVAGNISDRNRPGTPLFDSFSKVLDKAPTYTGVVYRGLLLTPDQAEALKIGSQWSLDAHSSSSKTRLVAEAFAVSRANMSSGKLPVVIQMETKHGADISSWASSMQDPGLDQKEVVLRSGTKAKITAIVDVPIRQAALDAADVYDAPTEKLKIIRMREV